MAAWGLRQDHLVRRRFVDFRVLRAVHEWVCGEASVSLVRKVPCFGELCGVGTMFLQHSLYNVGEKFLTMLEFFPTLKLNF